MASFKITASSVNQLENEVWKCLGVAFYNFWLMSRVGRQKLEATRLKYMVSKLRFDWLVKKLRDAEMLVKG